VNLQDIANYAQIFGVITVIGGAIFGLIQVSEFRRQRSDMIAAEVTRTFYSVDLADAITLVRSLPDHCPADELHRRGPQYERAAVIVNTSFETMGLLVFRRVADCSLVEQLAGGIWSCSFASSTSGSRPSARSSRSRRGRSGFSGWPNTSSRGRTRPVPPTLRTRAGGRNDYAWALRRRRVINSTRGAATGASRAPRGRPRWPPETWLRSPAAWRHGPRRSAPSR
jgi:hypothetical protein